LIPYSVPRPLCSSLFLRSLAVDIGAKVEIYRIIGELAAQGAGILIVSTDLLELLGLADRILVFFRGKIVNEFAAGETDSDTLLAAVTGVNKTAEALEFQEV
jgi:ribose transport system ATP-binding protein